MTASPPSDLDPVASEALLDRLPHRPPFRFLTCVRRIDPGRDGQARWDIDGTESFLAGHFPSRPLVPGVLIGEALAQLAGLVALGEPRRMTGRVAAMLSSVDLRFVRPVEPPVSLALHATLIRSLHHLHLLEVSAHVDDQCVCRGTLSLAGAGISEPKTDKEGSRS
jgi:3-hydroxyacyl-[acyl-carrier-protein] dehydratase